MTITSVRTGVTEIFAGLLLAESADLVSLDDPLNAIELANRRPGSFGRAKVILLVDDVERRFGVSLKYARLEQCETPAEIIDAATKMILAKKCPREARRFHPTQPGRLKLGTTPSRSGRHHPESILW